MNTKLPRVFLLCCGLATGVYVVLLMTGLASPQPTHTVNLDIHHNTMHEVVDKTNKESTSILEAVDKTKKESTSIREVVDKTKKESTSILEAVDKTKKESTSTRESRIKRSKKARKSIEAEANKLSNEASNVTLGKPVSNEASLNVSQGRNDSQKYVIFVCDEAHECMGWGDRQRAMVGVYALSIVTRRKFGIIMTVPCNITNFYVPNRVNWIIPDHELQGKSSISIMDVRSKAKMRTMLASMDFNAEYPQDVVYIRTNEPYRNGIRNHRVYRKRLPVWARGTSSKFFFHGWHTLMKPAERLAKRLRDFLHRIDFSNRTQPLACAHVRMGRSETLKADTEVRCNISDIPVLWNFLDGWVKKGSHVFLATDSVKVRDA